MHRVLEPQVLGLEAAELAERALDAPCRPSARRFLQTLVDGFQFAAQLDGRAVCRLVRPLLQIVGGIDVDELLIRAPVWQELVESGPDRVLPAPVVVRLGALVRQLQRRHVKQRVRVSRENARAGCSVHGAFLSLQALGMVVAVDYGAPDLLGDLVELVAEGGHLVGAVLVSRDDLVDRVDDNGDGSRLECAADERGRKPVHRHGAPSQVPDVDVPDVLGSIAERPVHVLEAMEAARGIKLQVDVEHPPLRASPAEPRLSLGERHAQLDKGERLARLGGARQKHLMALAENPVDERRRELGHVLPFGCQILGVGQIVGGLLHPVPPFGP